MVLLVNGVKSAKIVTNILPITITGGINNALHKNGTGFIKQSIQKYFEEMPDD